MADPFGGMFDGGNNGLDDLALGVPFTSFNSPSSQVQDRLQVPQSFPGFPQNSQPNANQQNLQKLQHFDERGMPTGPVQFLQHAPHQKLQHFGTDPVLSSASHQPFPSMQQNSQPQFTQLQPRSAEQFVPNRTQISMPQWSQGANSASNHPSYNMQRTPQQPFQQAPFRQPFGYGFPRASSPNPRLQHFAQNQDPTSLSMNSPQSERFLSSHSPKLQAPNQTVSLSFSNLSPKDASAKQAQQISPSQQQQTSPQQALRHYSMGQDMKINQQEMTHGRLHHLPVPQSSSPGSGMESQQSKPTFPNAGDNTQSFNPFFGGPESMGMHRNSPNKLSMDQQVPFSSHQFQNASVDPFMTAQRPMNDNRNMYPGANQHQMSVVGPPAMRYPFQEMAATPQELLHLKTSAILLQMQRLQQEIQRLRESNIDPQHPQLQQMQHQFSQLYRIYVVQEQQRMQHGPYQIQQGEQARMMRQQQPQDKANRIAVEALAKAALHNNEGQGHSPMNFPPMSMMQHGAAASNIPRPVEKPPKLMDPIKLPPSIVQKPPSSVWNTSSRPPATVLAKPSPIKNRRESSDAEPTPPSSPVDMVPEDTVSSITRRSLRECRKKTYKDDFDYNLSDEEGEKDHPIHLEQGVAGNSQVLMPAVAELPAFEEVEETMIVEKILSTRRNVDKNNEDKQVEEFLVKFKNYSYLHCEWAVVEKLARGDKRIQMKIKRYRAKQLTALSFLAEIDDEPFNPDYVEVDRVLDVSTGVEQGTGETITHYLVKWRSLPYEDSTWELEADVDEVKIKQFYKTREPLPPAARQYRPRPYPHEWQKLDTSMVYRNQNTLREYQLEGLNWLIFSWLNRQNSILADEMGLGKTIQSIAFLCELQRYGIRGPFLVIAPLSTISNWQREFETWSEINCVVYHGSSSSRHLIQEYEFYYRDEHGQPIPGIFKFEALVTTYEIIIADNVQLSTVPWRSVIIDEAHRLKNRNCKLLEGLNNLNMEHRVLLTGTPLQNNVEELFSLLNFLEPAQFPSQHIFLMEFGNLKTENQVEKLKLLLKPMMLRRLKEDVEKNIAPKEETIIEVELTTIQKKYYRAILERNFAFLSKGAGSTANVPNLMNTMMELRKCCNHPFLINGAEEKIIGEYNVTPVDDRHTLAMIEASGKLVLIDKLLPKLKIGGHRVLVFSQMVRCLDILEDYLVHRRYPYERIDGRVRGNMRQAAIDRFCKPDSDRFVFLLCTRAGGLGINLTAADTVIIFDSDWNPQNDLQAQARCHRIGQDKSVKVYRLITRNSYEREMFDKASLKLGLDKAVLQSMNTKENASNTQGMHKREIEDLLRRGAYGAVMDDDNDAGAKFCEEDIDQILERRTQVIQIESQGKGSTFAKASFVSAKGEEDIDVDDPNFWQKWAKKAELDVDYLNKDDRIIDAPRQRKQTKRFGNEDADYELSDLDLEEEDVPVPRRNAWTRVECFRVEKNLLIYGWGRWKEVLSSGRFKSKLAERDVEAMSRTIILYCLHHYRGDDKVKSFIRELIKLSAIKERMPSEDRDTTYSPVVNPSKGRGRIKKGRGSKNTNKSATALFEVGSDWRSIDPETLIVDEGYKKHLQHHCNKILLRVRLLFYLKNEVMGLFSSKVREGCNASEVEITIHSPEGDPPTDWWDEEADKSLLIGVFKYGYENYNLMRVDPTLCFLSRLGMPNHVMERTSADTTDPDMDAAEREEYEEKDDNDPDYQPEVHSKKDSRDDEDIDDEEDDKESASAVSSPATEKANESGEGTTGLRWPTASDMNTRLRRLIAGYQRVHKKQELKKVAAEKERERKEKFEEAIRQKELKKLEMAQKWSKREEVDFYRTVSTFGVEYDKNEDSYDWTKFRSLARLDKKNDDRLTEYYLDFMAMCRKVCGKAMLGDVERAKNVEAISEERANRCLHRIQLLSRIREDVLPHEKLDERLQLAKPSSDFPSWWECGKHDKDLLVGVSKHGISRTDYHLLSDPELCFVDIQTNIAAQQPTESPHGGMATERSTPVVPMSTVSSLNTGQERHEGAIQEHTKKSLLQHILTSESMMDSKTMSVDHSVTECEDQSVPQESGALSDSVLPKVEKHNPAGTVGHLSVSPRLGNSPGREIKSEGMTSLDESGGYTSNQIDNSESIQLDVSAVKQESMSVDEEVSSFRGTPVSAVSVNPMLMMDEDSQHNFSQDGLSNVGDSTMVSVRWPKDKVIMQRLDQLCDLVINGEWPVIEKPDLLQMQMAVPSPTLAGFSGLGADLDMGGVAPSFGITGEDGENPSKAFKVKRVRLEGLKLTFKKNKRKRKKDGEIAEGETDGLTGERPPQKEPGRKRTGRPPKKRDGELPSHTDTHQHGHSHHHHHHHHHHNPHALNVDSEFAQVSGHLFNVHPDMGQKPRKKRARKEKIDKPDKPSTGRKRGPRKPKGLKLGSAGGVVDSGGQHSLPVVEAPQPWAAADGEGATQEWPTAPVKVESSSQNWTGAHSALKDSTHSWPEAKFGVNRAKEWSSLDRQHGTSGPLSSIGVMQGRMNNEDGESVLKSPSENVGSISHRTIFSKPFDESQKQDDPSSFTRKEEHVIVVERETGRRLSGKMAPTFDRLGEWLEANPSFDVGEESAALVRAKDCLPVSLMSRLPRSDTPKSSHSNPSTPTAKTPTTPRQFFNPYSGFTYDPMHIQGFQSHSMPFVPYAGMPSSIFTMSNFGMPMGAQDAPARAFDVEKQKSPVPSSTPTSLSSNFVYGNSISGSNIQSSTAEARYESPASANATFPFLGFNGNGLSSSSPDKAEGSEDDEDGFSSSEEDTSINYHHSQDLKKMNTDSLDRSRSPSGDNPVIAP